MFFGALGLLPHIFFGAPGLLPSAFKTSLIGNMVIYLLWSFWSTSLCFQDISNR